MKNNFRNVLLFVSFCMRPFVGQLFINFLYFFGLMVAAVPMFFLCYATLNKPWLFWVFLPLLFIVAFWCHNVLFIKRRLVLHIRYLQFLQQLGPGNNIQAIETINIDHLPIPGNLQESMVKLQEDLNSAGIGRISRKLFISLAASRVMAGNPVLVGEALQQYVARWRQRTGNLAGKEFFFFSILLFPFMAIALLFTGGLGGGIKELIFMLGFIFAWFLHAGVIGPLMGLIAQDADGYTSSLPK